MSIPLPPLPVTHPDECIVVNAADIRARDQEIVRCVREAAAKVSAPEHMTYMNAAGQLRQKIAADICALEFKHVE